MAIFVTLTVIKRRDGSHLARIRNSEEEAALGEGEVVAFEIVGAEYSLGEYLRLKARAEEEARTRGIEKLDFEVVVRQVALPPKSPPSSQQNPRS